MLGLSVTAWMSLPPSGIHPTTFFLAYFSPVALAFEPAGMLGPWILACLAPCLQGTAKISFPRTPLTILLKFPPFYQQSLPICQLSSSYSSNQWQIFLVYVWDFVLLFFSLFPTRMSSPGGLVFHIPSSVPRTGVELPEPLCVRDTGEGILSLGGKLHSIDPILLTHSCRPRVPQCYYSSHVSLPYWKNNFWDFKSSTPALGCFRISALSV